MKKILLLIPLISSAILYSSEVKKAKTETLMEKTKINYIVRKGNINDKEKLKTLYKRVAAIPGGLARTEDEITDEYIDKALSNAVNNGLIYVAEYNGKLIGSVLKYKLGPRVFSHVLGEGSILVDPEFQGIGVGSAIFNALLNEIKEKHPEILRVELIARESNPAIKLYERLGFKQEGRFENRINGITGKLEADIPMAWFNPNFKK